MPKKSKPVVTDEIATAEKDITRDYIGRTLLNPDKVLRSESGGKGIEVYEDLLYDDRIFSEMQKRKLAVIGKEWEIVPASESAEDGKIADFVRDVFKSISYDTARQALLSGIVTGFKPAEIMWDYSEGDIWIREIRGRAPRRFVFDLDKRMRLLTWGNMIEGEELPERKFIVFRNPSDNDSPYGAGLGRPLYWCVWFKKNGVKFWATFLERFGQPTPWGKYPSGTDKEHQDKLLDALKAMQTDSCIITPDNLTVELLEATRASSVDSYETWDAKWDKAVTLIILGQTATTEGTPGKLGSEEARSEVRQEIVKADADLLCELQNNTLIPWLVDYNFPRLRQGYGGQARYPKVWIRTEPEQDLKPLAERDRILIREIGVPTPVSYIRDTYGIPEPEEGEEMISVPQTAQPFGFAEAHSARRIAHSAKSPSPLAGEGGGEGGQKKIDEIVEKTLKDGGIEEFRGSIEKIINDLSAGAQAGAISLEDLESKIIEQFKNVDIDKMKEILTRAILIADLTGRLSAAEI